MFQTEHLVFSHQAISNEDILNPGGAHHLRLSKLGTGNTNCACGQLHLCDFYRPVGLDMRPQNLSVFTYPLLHTGNIALQLVLVYSHIWC